jgi:hypothetical protein
VLDVSLAHLTKTRLTMQCRDGIACLIRYRGRGADLDVSIETLWLTATCSHLHPYLEHDPQVQLPYTMYVDHHWTIDELCATLRISRATCYRYVALARRAVPAG